MVYKNWEELLYVCVCYKNLIHGSAWLCLNGSQNCIEENKDKTKGQKNLICRHLTTAVITYYSISLGFRVIPISSIPSFHTEDYLH